jgi:hypothetical protein
MKTLRVTLADIIGPTGTPNSTATVHARYVDTTGRGRDVHLTDGTIVVPVRRVAEGGGDPEVFDFDVYANDVAPVREVDYGHRVEVSWTVTAPTGAKTSGVRRVAITDDMDAVVQLGLLAQPAPIIPGAGPYAYASELEALDVRVVVLEAGGGGGGGGVTVHNLLTGRSTADAHPTSAITGLDAALAGKATAAQGAKADTAVQPADLTTYATDAELTAGLATKAATSHSHATSDVTGLDAALAGKASTSHSHVIADTTGLQAALDAKAATSHTHTASQVSDSTTTGRALLTAADAAAARTTLALGTAATTAASDYATAAQGVLAGTASQPGHAHAGADITSGTVAAARLPAASDTASGIVELATTAEATTGTDTTRAVTAAGVKAVADTKAALSHNHAGADITSGTVAYARLPVGATASTVAAGDDSRIVGALQASTAQAINAQTGTSYTLVSGDAGKVVTLSNAAAITLNAPGSVFTAGQRVDVVVIGAGMATVVGTSGATANGTPSLVSRAQWSAFTILWTSATACVVIGDMA